ncbi:maleylpyruvate isomerase N-terminal domain-containing protein [Tessaracoccus oleiagri]|uniref:TIGR03086 family protein n=1 Tax=Tessaracoccus oleiagri TaxID=686624 RepID=A0A1G9I7Q3_9ACTN|nr:maleylpyruvate isomerase N-terminal domain-containing protein [Tessaracoccus oleiagri]SDL21085.1 TIGR03086 family protein [Tessaracoccus oleiagri]
MNAIAAQHAALSARFAELAAGVTDWDAPTPVREWTARDVVNHLVTWLPGMMKGYGVDLPAVDTTGDPNRTWAAHAANVQALVDDEEELARPIETDQGEKTVGQAIESFYLPDIFMHQYDIAKASGQPVGWNEEILAGIVEGMTPQADFLHASGQFGTPKVLDESHSLEDRLAALIGRDPEWTPPTR